MTGTVILILGFSVGAPETVVVAPPVPLSVVVAPPVPPDPVTPAPAGYEWVRPQGEAWQLRRLAVPTFAATPGVVVQPFRAAAPAVNCAGST